MVLKIFTTIIKVIWIATAFGMGPSNMDPKEFNVYHDTSDDSIILEIPDTSGLNVHEQGMVTVGYEVGEIVKFLEEEYDICVDFDNTVSIPSTKLRASEPTEVDTTLTGIIDMPFYASSLKFVTTDYAPHSGGYSQVLGYTGGNMTLNTVPCA